MHGSVLVIGGGIAGIQASLDLADRGMKVYLVERTPSIGGRMAQLDKTFPTNDCSICILAPKMVECGRHSNIQLLTYSKVKKIEGTPGNFKVTVMRKARYVDGERCTGCGACVEKCPKKVPNEYDMGLSDRKAIYLPLPQAVPRVMTIDKEHCLYLTKQVCKVCEKTCQANAIDFNQKDEEIDLKVDAIIVATGFDPYKPPENNEYGYGRFKNVVMALEFERIICASGPTAGELLRPSDGKHPKRIAIIQCVGSRDIKKRPYCSAVCCMLATKEAILSKEHDPDVDVSIFYTDMRAFGKGFQEYIDRAKDEYGIKYIRARPGEIQEDPKTGNLTVWYDDVLERKVKKSEFDLVLLCTALLPSDGSKELAEILGVEVDEYGFFSAKSSLSAPIETGKDGIFICGYCQGPKDIPECVAQGSGAAAKATEIMGG